MMERFSQNGLDRLWLGVDGWDRLRQRPETVRRARELGYLIGPYDSYHSIHAPGERSLVGSRVERVDKCHD